MKALKYILLPLIIASNLITLVSITHALDIGDAAPDFRLSTYDGKPVHLKDYYDKTVVLEWFNAGCPYVKKYYESSYMQQIQKTSTQKNVVWLTINSTRAGHRDFLNAEKARSVIEEWNIRNSTLLVDSEGEVGKLYQAKTTPHVFVINKGKIVYKGAIDDNSDVFADPSKATNFVQLAISEIEQGKPISKPETKPYGCGVKY